MLQKNQIYTVTVTDLNNLGYGIARIEEKVVFIDGALPEESARIKLIKVAKDYAVGKVEQILSPSKHRVHSDCPVSRPCGGCCFRELSSQAELEIKREYVKNSFRKAGISDAVISPIIPSVKESGYRNKVLYPVDENFRIGYYARHSHRIVPCSDCKLQSPVFAPILKDLEAFFAEKRPENLRHLYLRCAEKTGQIMVCPVLSTRHAPWSNELVDLLITRHKNVATVLLNVNPTEGNVVLGKECILLYGNGYLEDELCGLRFYISPLSFYQVNRGTAELLYEEAFRRIVSIAPKTLADLYCGTGTIGLIFASRLPSSRLKGIEIVEDAVKNARANAALNQISNAEFICADSMEAEIENTECVILDPPRKGSSSVLLKKLANAKTPNVVYISCNPDTLARDAAILIGLGYRMGAVTPVDMFPRTGSIECVTHFTLERSES